MGFFSTRNFLTEKAPLDRFQGKTRNCLIGGGTTIRLGNPSFRSGQASPLFYERVVMLQRIFFPAILFLMKGFNRKGKKYQAGNGENSKNGVPGGAGRRNIQSLIFIAIIILLLILACRVFAPFFTVILWSVLLYVFLRPFHKLLVRNLDLTKLKGKILQNVWAGVFAFSTIILILIPLSFVVFQLVKQIIELIRYMQDIFIAKPDFVSEAFHSVSDFLYDISAGQIHISADDIQRQILQFLSSRLQGVAQFSSGIAKNIGAFAFGLLMMFFCLYFFYIDGRYLAGLVLHTIPIRKDYLSALTGKFLDATKNLFFGYIVVAVIQGIAACVIFTFFNIKGALVFAILISLLSFIPMIGGSAVWWPLAISIFLKGEILMGIVFIISCVLFVSSIDMFLRPIFLRDRIKLHPLIIFFAILGGVSVFGANGLILGPMIIIFFLTCLNLFLTEHKIQGVEIK
jgi:predicted PurR-regulated permease PerM